MEKALKILNRKLEISIMHLYGSSGICFVKDIKELEEAIAELEEAMQPKTCVGCKYVSQGRYRVPCYTCARILHDEYEPKDNA